MDPNKIVNSVSSSAGKSTMTPSKVPEASSSLSGINNPLEKKEKESRMQDSLSFTITYSLKFGLISTPRV